MWSTTVAVLVVAALAAALTSSVAANTGATCSKATADGLVNADHLNDFLLPKPVNQVLCGPFTGRGSRAMLATVRAATCWGVQQWAVFAVRNGSWRLVTDRHVWILGRVVAAGSDLKVTSPVARRGDAYCDPTGGSVTRTWHWNGSRFVLVATHRAPPAVTAAEFYDRSLSRVIGCDLADEPNVPGGVHVICTSFSSATTTKVTLSSAGRVVVCTQSGSSNACNLGNLGDRVPTFRVGRSITVGRFRCQVLTAGVQCVVTRTGQGFLFGASSVTAVGGASLRNQT